MTTLVDEWDSVPAKGANTASTSNGSLADAWDAVPVKQQSARDAYQRVPILTAGIGATENGLRSITGMIGQAAGGIAGLVTGNADNVAKVQSALTYEPRTDAGKAIEHNIGTSINQSKQVRPVAAIGDAYNNVADAAGNVSPIAGAAIRTLPTAVMTLAAPEVRGALGSAGAGLKSLRSIGAAEDIARVEPALSGPKPRIKLNVDGTTTPIDSNAPKTASQPTAAPAQSGPTLANATPELQQKVAALKKLGSPIDQVVLNRHIEAESLPVPVKLTEGQATLDPVKISDEMNGRAGKNPIVSPDFYNQQGKALGQNLDAIRAQVAPDIATAHPTELGQTLIDRYKTIDAPIKADIRGKYKALEDANGGQFPLAGQDFVSAADQALQSKNITRFVPPEVKGMLDDLRQSGKMSFNDFENYRTILGQQERKMARAGDGTGQYAVGLVRNALESLPMEGEAANIKPLADAARSAAKARFDRLEADPAYKSAINDGVGIGEPSPLADKFINGYVTGSNARLANIKQMKTNLGNDRVANQTLAAATLDHLKGLAKADPSTGKFLADQYSKGIDTISPKLNDLAGQEAAQQLQQIGNVAKYTSAQPKGAYVNNSNSLTGALSPHVEAGIKGFLSAKTMGISDFAASVAKAAKNSKAAKDAVSPGAGIGPNAAPSKAGIKISNLLNSGPAASSILRSDRE